MKDGGPAFPTAFPAVHIPVTGMSLRQYYAGQAMIGILAGPSMKVMGDLAARNNMLPTEGVARAAGELADALLAELEKAVHPSAFKHKDDVPWEGEW